MNKKADSNVWAIWQVEVIEAFTVVINIPVVFVERYHTTQYPTRYIRNANCFR